MKKLYIIIMIIISSFIISSYKINDDIINTNTIEFKQSPVCLQTYYLIQKYANKYEIPSNIAYGIAHYETTYRGPFDTKYKANKTSKHKAYGVMQVKVRTASVVLGRKVTHKELLNNLETNIEASMKYLATLKKTYGTWNKALGVYNTGKPITNKYVKKIINFNPEKHFLSGKS